MKKFCVKTLCILLAMIISLGSIGLWASAQEEYETVIFGSYPQSLVTDEAILPHLSFSLAKAKSYSYFVGDDDYGTMKTDDFMKYQDVTYQNQTYRGVMFTHYRPIWTIDAVMDESDFSDYGYEPNTVYWFRFEPLIWKVLNPQTGLMICESIIDSQAFQGMIYGEDGYYNNPELTIYANDYLTSGIRTWLMNDFYNTAFSTQEKSALKAVTLDDCNVSDTVFLLSKQEALAYFPQGAPQADRIYSTYAKIQGLSVGGTSSPYTYWFLRTAADSPDEACTVKTDRNGLSSETTCNTQIGIRPAVCFQPTPDKVKGLKASSITTSSAKLSWTKNSKATGYRVYRYDEKQKKYVAVVKSVKTNSVSLSSLSGNTKVQCMVKAYFSLNGVTYWSKNSSACSFTTAPSAVKSLKATAKATSLALKWKASAGATAYRVLLYDASKKAYQLKQTVADTSAVLKSLKPGTTYKLRVQPIREDGDKTFVGDYTALSAQTLPNNTKITSLTVKDKKITVKYAAASGAVGYVVQYSTNKNFTSCVSKAVKAKTTYTSAALKAGKYYVRVRPYVLNGEKKVYSASYSAIKTITVK